MVQGLAFLSPTLGTQVWFWALGLAAAVGGISRVIQGWKISLPLSAFQVKLKLIT